MPWMVPKTLIDIGDITPTDSVFIVGNGTTWVGESGSTARTSLGAQESDADLTAIAALSGTGIAGRTGSDTWAVSSLTTSRVPRCSGTGTLGDSIIRDNGSGTGINGDPISSTRLTIYGTTGLGLRVSGNGASANQFVVEDIDDAAIPSTARPFTVFRHNAGFGSLSNANRNASNGTTSTQRVIGWDESQNICIGPNPDRPSAGVGTLVISQTSTKLTPASNQAGISAFDSSGTCELEGVDEAANRTVLTPHPASIMEQHASRMQALGLPPLRCTWGYSSQNDILGVLTECDMGMLARCVEYLMKAAGKEVELIRETAFEPTVDWDQRIASEQAAYDAELEGFIDNLMSLASKPMPLFATRQSPKWDKLRPASKPKPTWMKV